MSFKETIKVKELKWTVEKFKAKDSKEIEEKNIKPYEVIEKKHNCLLNEGITCLINLICGLGSPTAWDNAHAYLGVGNDATAPAAAQTGLQGASKKYKEMNAGYPQIDGQDSKWQADFIDGEAEWNWLEETIVNADSDSGDNLCRQNTDLGIKPAGQTWRLTATITWS
jgi:hypothetical protein